MKMKIFVLTLIFVLNFLANNSFAQNSKSIFGSFSTSWDVILNGNCDSIMTSTIVAAGDTNINSNNYKIITGLGGFLREDTLSGKVWFYDISYGTEFLVMDLSLTDGEFFLIYDAYGVPTSFQVDSSYYVNGLLHLRLTALSSMCGYHEKITFITGSGPSAGFNYQRKSDGFSVPTYMLCHYKNGIKVTGNDLFNDTCYMFEVGIAENLIDINKINIFPNPAADMINVDIKNNDNCLLEIYNVMGILEKTEIITNQYKQIDIRDLMEGIYVITARTKDNTSYQRLIIQR